MSTNFNRRRGAKANKPRKPRVCTVVTERGSLIGGAVLCGAVVQADVNGNRCVDHRAGR
jgi:hypothetical protein